MLQPANNSQRFAFNRILIGSFILYVCAFAILLRNKSFDAAGAVVVLIVFGIAYPAPRVESPRGAPFDSRFP